MATGFALFKWAIGQQESGGDYGARNGSSGALGKYQVMPGNLPGWEAMCGMPAAGPSYFLTHPLYQERMADCVLGRDYARYGARGAAAVWYSGQPNWHATFGNPPVFVYVNQVIARMTGHHGGVPGGTGGGGVGVGRGGGGPLPGHSINPPNPDYSPTVRASSLRVLAVGKALNDGAILINGLKG